MATMTNLRIACCFLAIIAAATTSASAFQPPPTYYETMQPFRAPIQPLLPPQQRIHSPFSAATVTLEMSSRNNLQEGTSGSDGSVFSSVAIFVAAFLYWYLLVFGAAASSAGWPVPDVFPLSPGWPPSDADLAPALEDSAHFFYLTDLIEQYVSGNPAALDDGATGQAVVAAPSQPPVVRLAIFNFAEAWVFAFLPALLADKRKLPLPVVLGTWLGALGLTNAFLAPYLAFRELFASFGTVMDDVGAVANLEDSKKRRGGRNSVISVGVGAIATAVVGYAVVSSTGSSTPEQWADFGRLAAADRTYTAFCVDLVLFSIFQPFVLRRVSDLWARGIH